MDSPPPSPTIVAQATAAAAGGVGILRVSGPLALELSRPFARGLPEDVDPRRAYFVDFVDASGAVLDQGLFLYFRAPHSFTGEEVVELHAHGSPRLLQLLQSQLLADGRARVAEPGEFTRRAFLNGRIDLARAEAIADLVSAESEAAVRAAAAQLSGALSARVKSLRLPLLALRTDLEGVLNFPEEAEGADQGLAERIDPLLAEARVLLADAGRGRLVRRGANVVLFGPVNAGKSTLFNRLVGEERALVDPEPGTTRDVLEARLEVGGLTVALFDTAGLRESAGRIEALGIARAKDALARSDLAVLVLPSDASEAELAQWRAEAAGAQVLVVESKCDLIASGTESAGDVLRASSGAGAAPMADVPRASSGAGASRAADVLRVSSRAGESPVADVLRTADGAGASPTADGLRASGRTGTSPAANASFASGGAMRPSGRFRVSGATGAGVDALRQEIAARLWSGGTPGAVALVSERHAEALRRATESLEHAAEAARVSTLEVVSGELGIALDAIGEITGETADAELLDAIFRRFCVGK